jgi:hypothetical protein
MAFSSGCAPNAERLLDRAEEPLEPACSISAPIGCAGVIGNFGHLHRAIARRVGGDASHACFPGQNDGEFA